MFSYIKNKFTNFASYMLGLDEKLKNAKNDAERVKILTQIAEAQKKRIEELDEESARLKEQIRINEEIDSLVSSDSSLPSNASSNKINTKIANLEKKIDDKIQNSKQSTSSEREQISLLKKVRKLSILNWQKDMKIKMMGNNEELEELVVDVSKAFDELDQNITKTHALIETPSKKN